MDSFNKILVSVLTVVFATFLGWLSAIQIDTNTKVSVLETQFDNLNKKVENGTLDRYTSKEAKKDFQLIEQKIKILENRILNLEK